MSRMIDIQELQLVECETRDCIKGLKTAVSQKKCEVKNLKAEDSAEKHRNHPTCENVREEKKTMYHYFQKIRNSKETSNHGTTDLKACENNNASLIKEKFQSSFLDDKEDDVIKNWKRVSEGEKMNSEGKYVHSVVGSSGHAQDDSKEGDIMVVKVILPSPCSKIDNHGLNPNDLSAVSGKDAVMPSGVTLQKKNAFAFMMSNRRKQTDIVNQVTQKDVSEVNEMTVCKSKKECKESDESNVSRELASNNGCVSKSGKSLSEKAGCRVSLTEDAEVVECQEQTVQDPPECENDNSLILCQSPIEDENEIVKAKEDSNKEQEEVRLRPVHKLYADSTCNAFAVLMANRHKQNQVRSSEKEKDANEDAIVMESIEIDNIGNVSMDTELRSDHPKKWEKQKRKRKRKSEDTDSSLLDFEASPKKDLRKRKRRSRKSLPQKHSNESATTTQSAHTYKNVGEHVNNLEEADENRDRIGTNNKDKVTGLLPGSQDSQQTPTGEKEKESIEIVKENIVQSEMSILGKNEELSVCGKASQSTPIEEEEKESKEIESANIVKNEILTQKKDEETSNCQKMKRINCVVSDSDDDEDIFRKPESRLGVKKRKQYKIDDSDDFIVDGVQNVNKKGDLNSESPNRSVDLSSETEVETPLKRSSRRRKPSRRAVESDMIFGSYDDVEIEVDKKEKKEKKEVPDKLVECKRGNISKFFTKLSKEEKEEVRNKNIFTIKADVHAPDDGLKSGVIDCNDNNTKDKCKEVVDQKIGNEEKRSSKRLKDRKVKEKEQEIEDLNRIELLEQINVSNSPQKALVKVADTNETPSIAEGLSNADTTRQPKIMEVDSDIQPEAKEVDTDIPNQSSEAVDSNDSFKKENKLSKSKRIINRKKIDSVGTKPKASSQGKESKSLAVTKKPMKKQMLVKQKKMSLASKKSQTSKKIPEPHEKTSSLSCSDDENERKISSICSEVEENSDTIFRGKTNTLKKTVRKSQSQLKKDKKAATQVLQNVNNKNRSSSSSLLSELEDDKENMVILSSSMEKARKPSLKRRLSQPQPKGAKHKKLILQQIKEENQTVQMKDADSQTAKKGKANSKRKVKRLTQKQKNLKRLSGDLIDSSVMANTVQCSMALVSPEVVVLDDTPPSKVISNKSSKKKILKSVPTMQKLKSVKSVKNRSQNQKNKRRLGKGKETKKLKTSKPKKTKAGSLNGNVTVQQKPKSSRKAASNARKTFVEISDGDGEENEITVDKIVKKKTKMKTPSRQGVKKLAPIFCKKSKSPEVKIISAVLSPSKLKARQDFLQSGVSDQMKKQLLSEKSQEEEICWLPFPKMSHIQQRTNDNMWNLGQSNTPLKDDVDCNSVKKSLSKYDEILLSKISWNSSKSSHIDIPDLDAPSLLSILRNIKEENPKFPVNTIFKCYLDSKKEVVNNYKKELEKESESEMQVITVIDENDRPGRGRKRKKKESLLSRSKRSKLGKGEQKCDPKPEIPVWQEKTPHLWTQVFEPKSGDQVIGNKGLIRKIRGWLQEWKNKCEVYAMREKSGKKKPKKRVDDFIVSDESSGWEDDDFVNTYVLCGPPGIGKTATVYALAYELGYKVLEVNASSRRPGRQVMIQLAEATQSHSVSSNSSALQSGVAALFNAKNANSKKVIPNLVEDSQGSAKDGEKRKELALVLFEDIDIVFDEWDEGFISTVNSFMATSKRPIILTVSNSSPSVLAKIKGDYEKVEFARPSEDLIAQHLQLMCLANGIHMCREDVEYLTHVNKCDIRQSILDLQLCALSGSSGGQCQCYMSTEKVKSEIDIVSRDESSEEVPEDLNPSVIFPDALDMYDRVSLHKLNVLDKTACRTAFSSISELRHCEEKTSDNNDCQEYVALPWTIISNNLPLLLPFPVNEKKKEIDAYPLKPGDPLLKMTKLWERHSWLSLDDEDDLNETSSQTVENEVQKEEEDRFNDIPKDVHETSADCLKTLASLYNHITDLDVIDLPEHKHLLTSTLQEKGWWMQKPVAGLSDIPKHHHSSRTIEDLTDICQELGYRAVKYCSGQISSSLLKPSPGPWQQLTLNISENEQRPCLLPHTSRNDRLREEQRSMSSRIVKQLPTIHQLSASGRLNYLPMLRSLIRHDELGAAVNKSRRGRRFLSYLSQLGIMISVEDRIRLANALLR